jgi:hypothetical protein
VALGGAVDALMTQFGQERELQHVLDQRGAEIELVARRGAARAVADMLRRWREEAADLQRLGDRAAALADAKPNDRAPT